LGECHFLFRDFFFLDAFAVPSKLSGEEQSSGLQVAIICILIGFLLLLVIIAFACFKRRQSSRSRKSEVN